MNIKVCDYKSNSFGHDFSTSVADNGFAVITKHGIDHGLIKSCQQAWREFFLSPQMFKDSFINPSDPNMGYRRMRSEVALGNNTGDLKEFLHWRPNYILPKEISGLTKSIYYQLENLGLEILSCIDKDKYCNSSDNTILRTIYYPAMDFFSEPNAVRAAAHEDVNFITLLVAASAPGLQVLDKKGKWHDAPYEENSVVVNAGDMLQLASNNLYKSTTHRVVNPDNNVSDRISMPLFLHPRSETLLAEGVTAKQFLDKRLKEIYK